MFNRIVVQEEGRKLLDEFNLKTKEYGNGYHIADSLEATSTICSQAIKARATGPIFGGMLLSGKRAAEIAKEIIRQAQVLK